jgi:hypothetical protein
MIIRTAARARRRRCSAEGAPVTRDEILDEIQAAMLAGKYGSYQALSGSSPITFTSPSSKAHQKSGPFAPPALSGFNAPIALPTPAVTTA